MRRRKSGFTLLEVIIALAIIGILAAGFLPVFFSAYLQIIDAGKRSKELNIAQDLNESIIMQTADVSTDELNFEFKDINGQNPVTVVITGELVENGSLPIFISLITEETIAP